MAVLEVTLYDTFAEEARFQEIYNTYSDMYCLHLGDGQRIYARKGTGISQGYGVFQSIDRFSLGDTVFLSLSGEVPGINLVVSKVEALTTNDLIPRENLTNVEVIAGYSNALMFRVLQGTGGLYLDL